MDELKERCGWWQYTKGSSESKLSCITLLEVIKAMAAVYTPVFLDPPAEGDLLAHLSTHWLSERYLG